MTNVKEMDRGKSAREKLIIGSLLGFVSQELFSLATYREKFHVEHDSTVPPSSAEFGAERNGEEIEIPEIFLHVTLKAKLDPIRRVVSRVIRHTRCCGTNAQVLWPTLASIIYLGVTRFD